MMHTLEELQAMANEQLDEAVALSRGWKLNKNKAVWMLKGIVQSVCKDYQPTADTDEGKAQAFDLMVKFGIVLDRLESHSGYIAMWASKDKIDIKRVKNKDPQRAITIASILSAQENKLAVK